MVPLLLLLLLRFLMPFHLRASYVGADAAFAKGTYPTRAAAEKAKRRILAESCCCAYDVVIVITEVPDEEAVTTATTKLT